MVPSGSFFDQLIGKRRKRAAADHDLALGNSFRINQGYERFARMWLYRYSCFNPANDAATRLIGLLANKIEGVLSDASPS